MKSNKRGEKRTNHEKQISYVEEPTRDEGRKKDGKKRGNKERRREG